MPKKPKEPKRKLPHDDHVAKDHLKVKCLECDFVNPIPIARFYDGFDGDFLCNKCTYTLDLANHVMDE